MNFLANHENDELEFNLIPLIDVMLALLLFFIVSTTFDQRSLLRVNLPQGGSSSEQPGDLGLAVIIDAGGRYFVDQRELPASDAATLRAALEPLVNGDPSRQVMIRADAATPHQAVTTALDVLGRLGFARIAIATVPVEDGG